MAKEQKQKEWWTNRIVKYGEMPANQFLAHEMNARRHPAKQREALRGSLDAVGWIAPTVVSARSGKLLDGHARIEEALSVDEVMAVPFVEIEVTEDEERLILAAYDPITGLATYDKDALSALLKQVQTDDDRIKDMLDELAVNVGLLLDGKPIGAGGDDFDTTPEETQTRVGYGDLWQCGEHRVLCGDSTKAEDVARVMAGERADMVFTDPPYGMNLDTDWSDVKGSLRLNGASHGTTGNKYDPVTGDDKPFDPAHIFEQFGYVREMFLWGADYYVERIPNRVEGSWIVWDKRKESQSEAIGSEFELCWSKSKHKRRMLRHDWFGFLSSSNSSEARNRLHPNQKPTSLAVDMLTQWGSEAGTVVDLYGGSGTTLIACERTNRNARVIEIEPKYVNVILSRWEAETGKTAQLLERNG